MHSRTHTNSEFLQESVLLPQGSINFAAHVEEFEHLSEVQHSTAVAEARKEYIKLVVCG